jgi:DNA-directed RNA polymerase specialized sigma24 family protein
VLLVSQPPEGGVPFPEVSDPELIRALLDLTHRQRSVVVLRFFLDWSVADVAEALGNKPGTVRALTAQGMERLRRVLRREEVSGEARG